MESAQSMGQPSFKELTRRYWKWEAVGVVMIAVGIAVSWWALLQLAELRFQSETSSIYWLSPSAVIWGAPAFFAGILMATWPTDVLYRRLLGDRYPEFRDYQTRKFGYDGRRWMLVFYVVFGSANAVLIGLLLDTYVCFGPRAIHIDELWALEPSRFRYDEVMEIRVSDRREMPSGEVVEKFTVALHFADGHAWTSNGDRWFAGREHLREIVAHVASRSGIPAVELSILSQSELTSGGALGDHF
jgi:hypothetical protein